MDREIVIRTKLEQLENDYCSLITAQDYLAVKGEWNAYYIIRSIMDGIDREIDKLTTQLKKGVA